MTVFIRPEFTPGTLPTFNGYHLQIFASGRAKISLQTLTLKKKQEFYTVLPKRDREGLRRQKKRSLKDLPAHFAAVDQVLSDHPDAKVFRVHEKGNNNWTADNAHDLNCIARAIVGSDIALGVPEDFHRQALRAAGVPQLVLHPVPEGVHGDLLVGDDGAQPLHEHGGGFVIATGLGVGGKDGVGIREPNLMLSEALCGPV